MKTIWIDTDRRGVATVVLNRKLTHNAINAQMIAELSEAAAQLADDSHIRVVVLTGAGATFCAGADLTWMQEQMAADGATRRAEATALAMMLKALNELPKPLIGRVQGNAFGGGVGLMSVCDAVVAADTAIFGLTETRLGLIPATIGPYVVARLGEARARRVFFSSRKFDCAEAIDLGLVAQGVTAVDLDGAVEAEIEPYLACAPGAVAEAKSLVRQLGPVIDDTDIAASVEALIARWQSDEAREGTSAFLEKRKPKWASG